MPRFDRVEKIGRVRVYDNGGRSSDRYIVLFEDFGDPTFMGDRPVRPYGERHSLSMSGSPTHPQGVSLWGGARPGPWLGRRIPFTKLPENVQRHVIMRASED